MILRNSLISLTAPLLVLALGECSELARSDNEWLPLSPEEEHGDAFWRLPREDRIAKCLITISDERLVQMQPGHVAKAIDLLACDFDSRFGALNPAPSIALKQQAAAVLVKRLDFYFARPVALRMPPPEDKYLTRPLLDGNVKI